MLFLLYSALFSWACSLISIATVVVAPSLVEGMGYWVPILLLTLIFISFLLTVAYAASKQRAEFQLRRENTD